MELPSVQLRLLEEATDEVARLDICCSRESPAVTLACWLATVSEAVVSETASLDALVAAAADPVHDAGLIPDAFRFRSFLAAEERRVRGGAPFALARWETIAPALATYPNRDRLEAAWRAGTRDRPVLGRAIATAAWLDDPLLGGSPVDLASSAIALLLCANARTAHPRFLPLGSADPVARAAAAAAWRDGDEGPWQTLVLETIARGARAAREAISRLDHSRERDEAAISVLGRAGITARRVLEQMHDVLATTMPATADALDLSRPAAAAALDRLVESGVAREVTGRARDRVYAWVAPLDAVGARRVRRAVP